MKFGLPLRFFTICIVMTIFGSWCSSGVEAAPLEQLSSGTSSKSARQKALDAIPYQELNEETRQLIAPILNKPSIYRRLPITQIDVDPDYFVYLVRYPEVIVNIWKIMGVTQMVTNRIQPFRVSTDDGAGTVSDVELLYGTPNLHIFLGEGTYEGPVLRRKLNGKCILILRTDYRKNADGKPVAVNSLDVFLKVENATASLVAKTLNPIVGKTADHNFVESLNFIQRLNETTAKNGPGVQRMANRLTDIKAGVRQDFIKMAGVVFERNSASGNAQAVYPAAYRESSSSNGQSPSQSARPASSASDYYRGVGGPASSHAGGTGNADSSRYVGPSEVGPSAPAQRPAVNRPMPFRFSNQGMGYSSGQRTAQMHRGLQGTNRQSLANQPPTNRSLPPIVNSKSMQPRSATARNVDPRFQQPAYQAPQYPRYSDGSYYRR